MVIKCDPRAYAKCPTKELCGPYCDDVCFEEGSECDAFNQEVINAPQTNADRIRAMSDEELAKLFEDGCPDDQHGKNCPSDPCSCLECWVRYLQQSAEEVQENAG